MKRTTVVIAAAVAPLLRSGPASPRRWRGRDREVCELQDFRHAAVTGEACLLLPGMLCVASATDSPPVAEATQVGAGGSLGGEPGAFFPFLFFLFLFLFFISFSLFLVSFFLFIFHFLFFLYLFLFLFSFFFFFFYFSSFFIFYLYFLIFSVSFLSFFLFILFLLFFLFTFISLFLFIYLFIYLLLPTLFFLIPFLYSFLFNIFPPLIFLLFEMKCKFVLGRIISCSGYNCLARVIITIWSDHCSDLF
jgi:hypothetical protein